MPGAARRSAFAGEGGYAMAALLVAMSIMSIGLTMLMPAWGTMVRRERETELVFRGEQYAKAVARYQRARGAFPPSVDVLVNEKFLRKKYKDPMTENANSRNRVGQADSGGATPPATGRGAAPAGAACAAGARTGYAARRSLASRPSPAAAVPSRRAGARRRQPQHQTSLRLTTAPQQVQRVGVCRR